jgi:hypothetical protein
VDVEPVVHGVVLQLGNVPGDIDDGHYPSTLAASGRGPVQDRPRTCPDVRRAGTLWGGGRGRIIRLTLPAERAAMGAVLERRAERAQKEVSRL